jgi:hypothetical protein
MYYVNLVHSRIDIFDSNHKRTESLIQWHNKIKAKIPLVYDALCKATDWKKTQDVKPYTLQIPFPALHTSGTRQ